MNQGFDWVLEWFALDVPTLRFKTYDEWDIGDEVRVDLDGYVFLGRVSQVNFDERSEVYEVMVKHLVKDVLDKPLVEADQWNNDFKFEGYWSSILEDNLGLEFQSELDFELVAWRPNPTVTWRELLQFVYYKLLNYNVYIHYDGSKFTLKDYPTSDETWITFTWSNYTSSKPVYDARLTIRYYTKTYKAFATYNTSTQTYTTYELTTNIGIALPIPIQYGTSQDLGQFLAYRRPENIYFDVTYTTHTWIPPQTQLFDTPLHTGLKASIIHQQYYPEKQTNYVTLQGWF